MRGGFFYDKEFGGNEIGVNDYNGSLPSFYEKNRLIKLADLGWYQIQDIIYDETISSWVALTNYRTDSIPNGFFKKIITLNYHQLPYEVYEFDIDFSSYEGIYQLSLVVKDDEENIVKEYYSEPIEVQESYKNVFEIKASNTENNEVNYQTGIQHTLRLPYVRKQTVAPESNVEINRTDTRITHIKGGVIDKFNFEFQPMQGNILMKLARILS